VTAPLSQGKPLTKAQAARRKAKQEAINHHSGRARAIDGQFIELFHEISDEQRTGMTTNEKEEWLNDLAESMGKPLHGEVNAKKKAVSRFKEFRMFLDRGVPEVEITLAEYAIWTCMWNEERFGFTLISISQIVRQTPLSRWGVQKAIAGLRKKGLLRLVKRGDTIGKSNCYLLSPVPNEEWKSAPYATGLPTPMQLRAETYATGLALPDRKEEVVTSSSFQTGRSGPTDARLGDARSVLPTKQTNADGETNPLGPPSTSMHEDAGDIEFRKMANKMIDQRLAMGEPLETIRTVSRLTIAKGDSHKQRLFDEEIAKRRAG